MARVFGNRKHRARVRAHRPVKVLSKDDPKFWERALSRCHLSMNAGSHEWLSYGHRVSDLDYDGVKTYATSERVREFQEWPISL